MALGFGSDAGNGTWARRRAWPVYAERGMVASAHPLITAAGVDVLQRGGNAVDAAVAAGLVAAVVMPEMCGLGGDLFAVVHDPRRGAPDAILGSGIAPMGATIEQMRAAGDEGGKKMPFRGPLSIGVPGMVDAYFTLLGRYGSRSFGEVAEAAIHYAEGGHPISAGLAEEIHTQRDLLARFPASRDVFLQLGDAPAAGSVLTQPGLARTLRAIAAGGRDAFYTGPIAREIAATVRGLGGALAESDLAPHRTVVEPPIAVDYRGYRVMSTGLPSHGLIMLESLAIGQQAMAADTPVGSATWVHLLAESKKRAVADRIAYAQDPLTGATPVDRLLSPAWAAKRAGTIDPQHAADDVPPGNLQDGDTTYLCVVDGSGMMVSLIQSVSAAFGSGVVGGETGVVLNNRVGRGFSLDEGHVNQFAPGKRTMHTLHAFLVADREGVPVLVGGTPGGDGQPQWNMQMVSYLVDGGYDVQGAIDAPRWTSWPATDPSTLPNPFELRLEERFGEDAIAQLERMGHRVVRQGAWDGGGTAQMIALDRKTGVLVGGTDGRGEGIVSGF